MKRNVLTGILAGALVLGAIIPTAAAVRTVPVQVDGKITEMTGSLQNGVTHVPLRGLLDAFGGWNVRWDGEKKMAVADRGQHSLAADPATGTLRIDGNTYDGSIYVTEGCTYVPLRLTATICGAGVLWDKTLGGAAVTSPGAAYDAEELYWLSRIISAESQGESMAGQIAVGNVVLNRVRSSTFPDTVREVVFDKKDGVQFEPVSNGTVYRDPTPQSVEAARRVLNGESQVGECLYFYAPALSKGAWISGNRPYSTTIGCHQFYL